MSGIMIALIVVTSIAVLVVIVCVLAVIGLFVVARAMDDAHANIRGRE